MSAESPSQQTRLELTCRRTLRELSILQAAIHHNQNPILNAAQTWNERTILSLRTGGVSGSSDWLERAEAEQVRMNESLERVPFSGPCLRWLRQNLFKLAYEEEKEGSHSIGFAAERIINIENMVWRNDGLSRVGPREVFNLGVVRRIVERLLRPATVGEESNKRMHDKRQLDRLTFALYLTICPIAAATERTEYFVDERLHPVLRGTRFFVHRVLNDR